MIGTRLATLLMGVGLSLTKEERANFQRIIKAGKSSINDFLKDSKKTIEEAKQILREKADKKGIRHNL